MWLSAADGVGQGGLVQPMGWGDVAECSRWGGAMWLSAADGVGQCGLGTRVTSISEDRVNKLINRWLKHHSSC